MHVKPEWATTPAGQEAHEQLQDLIDEDYYHHPEGLQLIQQRITDTGLPLYQQPLTVRQYHACNKRIDPEEVAAVLRALSSSVSAGDCQVTARAMKKANCLATQLAMAQAFTHVLNTADIPDAWHESVETPIPKQPGTQDTMQHRRIGVLPLMRRLFCAVLQRRVVKAVRMQWNMFMVSEEQTGFVPHRGTTDCIHTLRTALSVRHGLPAHQAAVRRKRAQPAQGSLWSLPADQWQQFEGERDAILRIPPRTTVVVFLDLSKAYDSVNHVALMSELYNRNVFGPIARVIHKLLQHARSRVRVGPYVTPAVSQQTGVVQGDPLSPILFNIVLQPVLDKLRMCGHGVPWMRRDRPYYNADGSTCNFDALDEETELDELYNLWDDTHDRSSSYSRLACMAYADDIALIAPSVSDMQRLLDVASEALSDVSMTINTRKTKAMCFATPSTAAARLRADCSLHVGGASIEVVREYTYLGELITDNIASSVTAAAKRGEERAAVAAKRIMRVGICNGRMPVRIMLMLFKAHVRPLTDMGHQA
jgi:hypothetical protein